MEDIFREITEDTIKFFFLYRNRRFFHGINILISSNDNNPIINEK